MERIPRAPKTPGRKYGTMRNWAESVDRFHEAHRKHMEETGEPISFNQFMNIASKKLLN